MKQDNVVDRCEKREKHPSPISPVDKEYMVLGSKKF